MKKLIALLAPMTLVLGACATGTTGTSSPAANTTQQLGEMDSEI